MVVQQSFRSVESTAEALAACAQHGILVQKPMIAVAGARAAMIRTIARASGFRFILDASDEQHSFHETVELVKRFPWACSMP
jgi:hypothetical protein